MIQSFGYSQNFKCNYLIKNNLWNASRPYILRTFRIFIHNCSNRSSPSRSSVGIRIARAENRHLLLAISKNRVYRLAFVWARTGEYNVVSCPDTTKTLIKYIIGMVVSPGTASVDYCRRYTTSGVSRTIKEQYMHAHKRILNTVLAAIGVTRLQRKRTDCEVLRLFPRTPSRTCRCWCNRLSEDG